MSFKTKKIRKTIPEKELKTEKQKEVFNHKKITLEDSIDKLNGNKKLKFGLGLAFSLSVIAILIFAIIKTVSSIDFKFFLKAAGQELKVDSYNHSNFLILGTGGKNHDGADLTDTMIVASLDDENKLITMVSIPRDIYIKDEEIGNSKVNEVYYNAKNYYQNSAQALTHLRTKIESIVGIPIHYYLKVDFNGFKELVDALGGIDIYVEESIYDPYYPKDGTYLYDPFSISAGQHHLDGATALKYARSRKTTSDFDRARRQQEIIYAVKEKSLQTEIIFDQEKITGILNTLRENIETDISLKEILTLGSMADEYSTDQILHRLIHDDPTQCGGFLYTPAREFYSGMFVLIPAGGFEFIHLYSDLNFNMQKIATEKSRIHILNGTKRGGVAGETKQILKRFCFDITRFGNARETNLTETVYYYREIKNQDGEVIKSRPESLNFLQKIIPGRESTIIPPEYMEYLENADIIVEIGADYTNTEKYLSDPFYSLPAAAPKKAEAPNTTTSESAPVETTPETPAT